MQQQQHTHSCYSLLLTCVSLALRTSSNSIHPPAAAACKSIRQQPSRPWGLPSALGRRKALAATPSDAALVCGRSMRASFLGSNFVYVFRTILQLVKIEMLDWERKLRMELCGHQETFLCGPSRAKELNFFISKWPSFKYFEFCGRR